MSRKPDVWMPFFIGDYLGDTAHLSTEQHGAYLLLLLAAWKRKGTLPNDPAQLATIARLPLPRWRQHAPVIVALFKVSGDQLLQGRLVEEYEKALAANAAQKENGKRGGRPKKEKPNETHGFQSGSIRLNPNESPSPSPIKQQQKQDQKTAPDGDLFAGISPQVAADFRALRAKLRAPITATAIKGIRREAMSAGISLEAALTICCERSWRGFKAAWLHDARASPGNLAPSRQMSAVATLLGVHTNDLASRPRAVVRQSDSPLSGELVPAEPRRLPGSGCAGQGGDALGTPSLGETSFGMD